MTTTRTRIFILALLAAASLAAFAAREENVDELIARPNPLSRMIARPSTLKSPT